MRNICEVVKSVLKISNVEIQPKFINYPSLDGYAFISRFVFWIRPKLLDIYYTNDPLLVAEWLHILQ